MGYLYATFIENISNKYWNFFPAVAGGVAGGVAGLYNRKVCGGCVNPRDKPTRPQEARQGVLRCPGVISFAPVENAV